MQDNSACACACSAGAPPTGRDGKGDFAIRWKEGRKEEIGGKKKRDAYENPWHSAKNILE